MGILYDTHKDEIEKILKAWELPPLMSGPVPPPARDLREHRLKEGLEDSLKRETNSAEFVKTLRTVQGHLNNKTPSTTNSGRFEEDMAIAAIVTAVLKVENKTQQELAAAYLNANVVNPSPSIQGGQPLPNDKLPDKGEFFDKANNVRLSVDKPAGQMGMPGSLTITASEKNNKGVHWSNKNDSLVTGSVAAYGAGGEVTINNFSKDKFDIGMEDQSRIFGISRGGNEDYREYYSQYRDLIMKLSAAGMNVKTPDGKDARTLLKPQDQLEAEKACKDKIAEVKAQSALNNNQNNDQNQNQNQNPGQPAVQVTHNPHPPRFG